MYVIDIRNMGGAGLRVKHVVFCAHHSAQNITFSETVEMERFVDVIKSMYFDFLWRDSF